MILLTVGTQLPFDRLVRAMDALAPDLAEPVVAQIGRSSFAPRHLDARAFISPAAFAPLLAECRLIVSHAGTGSIMAALRHGKPIIIMSRRALLGEHRNDHQVATAAHFAGRTGITLVDDRATLRAAILGPLPAPVDEATTRPRLIRTIRAFLQEP